jgi:hypothetical protein
VSKAVLVFLLAMLASLVFWPYSAECVEGLFSEVCIHRIPWLRNSCRNAWETVLETVLL